MFKPKIGKRYVFVRGGEIPARLVFTRFDDDSATIVGLDTERCFEGSKDAWKDALAFLASEGFVLNSNPISN